MKKYSVGYSKIKCPKSEHFGVMLSCLVPFFIMLVLEFIFRALPRIFRAKSTQPPQKMAPTPMAVAGPSTWNSLPKSLLDPSNSASVFVRLLKTFIFSEYRCIQRIRRFGEDALLYKSTFYITFYNIPGSRH